MTPTLNVPTRQGTIVLARPDGHPVSVMDAKRQLRIDPDDTDQDEMIAALCATAHRTIESQLGYPILRQTRQTHLKGFPTGEIWLGGGELLTVSAVTYYDTAGVQQTLASTDYIVDAVSRPATLQAAPFKDWPSTQPRAGAVAITWSAGWATASDVPEDLSRAMLLLIGHYEQNREAVVIGQTSTALDMAVDMLIEPYRLTMFG